MRRGWPVTLCALMAIAAPFSAAAQEGAPGESGSAVVGQGSDLVSVARVYLDTLYAFDFQALGDLLSADALFRDPTAAAVAGAEISYRGRDAILAGFVAGADGTRNASFLIEQQFVTGDHVVLTMRYRTEIQGDAVGRPGEWIPVDIAATTVLRIVDGLIVEHIDYVDYADLLQQVAGPG